MQTFYAGTRAVVFSYNRVLRYSERVRSQLVCCRPAGVCLSADFYFTLYWNDTRYNTSEPFDAETMFWPETEFVNRLQEDVRALAHAHTRTQRASGGLRRRDRAASCPPLTRTIRVQTLTLDWTFQPGWYGVPARLIPAHGMDTVEYGSWWSAYARVGATFVTKLFLQSFPMVRAASQRPPTNPHIRALVQNSVRVCMRSVVLVHLAWCGCTFLQDIQNATLRIESPYFGDGRIRYVPLPGSEKYVASSKLDVVGWTVKGAGAETRDNYYDAFDETYSQLKVFVTVSRLTTYYMGRLVTNVSLLVFMAFLASTLRPDIPERYVCMCARACALLSLACAAPLVRAHCLPFAPRVRALIALAAASLVS
ncbi:hypothetical protein EON66_07715 [archaeon]|nr:MAG: hypothetical protein EON66_07715 [archaeon]